MVSPEEARSAARKLNKEAERLREAAHFADAEPVYLEALALHEQFSEPTSLEWAICRDNLGTLYAETGRAAESVTVHQKAMSIFRQHPDRPIHSAICANNLGEAYAEMGNADEAKRWLSAAKDWHEAAGKREAGYVGTLVNLASLHIKSDDLSEAEPLLQHSRAISRYIGGPADHFAILGEASLGDLLIAKGKHDEARVVLEGAVRRAENTFGSTAPSRSLALANLGALHRQTGDLQSAEVALQSALEAFEAGVHGTSSAQHAARSNLALVYERLDRSSEAVPLWSQNVESELLRTRDAIAHASESELLSSLLTGRQHFANFLSFVRRRQGELPELVPMAFEFLLQRKGLAADALAAYRRHTTEEQSPEIQSQMTRLSELRAQIAEDIRVTSARFVRSYEEWTQRTERLRRMRRDADEIERSLAPVVRHIPREALAEDVTIDRFFDALPIGTTLLEFTALCPPPTATERQSENVDSSSEDMRYLVFVVTGGDSGSLRLVDLGPASGLNELVADFRAALDVGSRARDVEPPTEVDQPADEIHSGLSARLQAQISGPIVGALEGVERLIICPDSHLGFVPFDALPNGTGRFWIDDFEIRYLPSGRDLLQPENEAGERSRGQPIVVAAPQYSIDSTAKGPYRPLDGARKEGIDVAAQLGVEPHLGPNGTKAAITDADRPSILHIATHGFFDREFGTAEVVRHEGPAIAPKAEVLRYRVTTGPPGELSSLLLRSGLALAGANDAWKARQIAASNAPEELGYGELLAADIVSLDLVGTSMVVLSACDTGLGIAYAGQGVWGLQLAFRLAGARTLIMSLWKVGDDATHGLMVDFYRRLLDGEGKASALRAAALHLRERHPHPGIWASFLCLGDDEPLPAEVIEESRSLRGEHTLEGAD